ncbi:hypothetical protein HYC85_022690 [Camellia sinensis]|uniref:Pseudouridine synthase RsuA/RluA-like domain-containing protein n=1 Tax=Camellia sinensis TaxID=4442 RepID=A0A7J7GER5_CAMSI|nr:hypothetical protein HYC85_022690 [Camellia sinensis]
MPLCPFLLSLFLLSPPSLFKIFRATRFASMADQTHFEFQKTQLQNDPKIAINYPGPLSPPLPAVSKQMELSRAMEASSKSNLFSLSRSDMIFEDEWIIVMNKPRGCIVRPSCISFV